MTINYKSGGRLRTKSRLETRGALVVAVSFLHSGKQNPIRHRGRRKAQAEL